MVRRPLLHHEPLLTPAEVKAYARLNYPRPSGYSRRPNMVIFHHTGGGSDPRRWQIKSKSGSYHWLVDNDTGQLIRGVPENRVSWGALDDNRKRADRLAINIALIADMRKERLSHKAAMTMAMLLARIEIEYPIETVTTHKAVSPRNKPDDDPGLEQILSILG